MAQRTCDDEVLDYVSTGDNEDYDDERLGLVSNYVTKDEGISQWY